ncbi:MAG: type II toxin-antitoxin system Phd/YefM family antitoxin [Gammaproteobacteria bacterium]
MQVSIREFKTHLSRYLTQARAGQAVEITSHRKVVARVIGVPPEATEGLARLMASGAGQWSGGKPAGAEVRLSDTGRPVSALVLDGRG